MDDRPIVLAHNVDTKFLALGQRRQWRAMRTHHHVFRLQLEGFTLYPFGGEAFTVDKRSIGRFEVLDIDLRMRGSGSHRQQVERRHGMRHTGREWGGTEVKATV